MLPRIAYETLTDQPLPREEHVAGGYHLEREPLDGRWYRYKSIML